MRQLALFKENALREFGGSCLQGKRKIKRPLSIRGTNHLVLKATSSNLLLKRQSAVKTVLFRYAERFGVKIYSLAVQADHIHLKFRVGSRTQYRAWIRTITAQLVRAIPKLKWRLRPWSRIVKWGKDYLGVKKYVIINAKEAKMIESAHELVRRWQNRFKLCSDGLIL